MLAGALGGTLIPGRPRRELEESILCISEIALKLLRRSCGLIKQGIPSLEYSNADFEIVTSLKIHMAAPAECLPLRPQDKLRGNDSKRSSALGATCRE